MVPFEKPQCAWPEGPRSEADDHHINRPGVEHGNATVQLPLDQLQRRELPQFRVLEIGRFRAGRLLEPASEPCRERVRGECVFQWFLDLLAD